MKELLAFPKDGYEREIVNGELIVSLQPVLIMDLLSPCISSHLGAYLFKHKIEKIFDGQTGCGKKNSGTFIALISSLFVTTQ